MYYLTSIVDPNFDFLHTHDFFLHLEFCLFICPPYFDDRLCTEMNLVFRFILDSVYFKDSIVDPNFDFLHTHGFFLHSELLLFICPPNFYARLCTESNLVFRFILDSMYFKILLLIRTSSFFTPMVFSYILRCFVHISSLF